MKDYKLLIVIAFSIVVGMFISNYCSRENLYVEPNMVRASADNNLEASQYLNPNTPLELGGSYLNTGY